MFITRLTDWRCVCVRRGVERVWGGVRGGLVRGRRCEGQGVVAVHAAQRLLDLGLRGAALGAGLLALEHIS